MWFVVGKSRFICPFQEEKKREVLIPGTEKAFTFFTNFLKKNPSGFLVGDGLTWVDLLVADGVAGIAAKAPEILYKFPEVTSESLSPPISLSDGRPYG